MCEHCNAKCETACATADTLINTEDNRGAIRADEYHIAVDLDGTLAEYHGWKGEDHIGEPIASMVEKVAAAVDQGKKVSIFSARITDEMQANRIAEWCNIHGILHMISGFTNIKHKEFKEFWDDRAKQVVPNSGQFLEETPMEHEKLTEEMVCAILGITPKALAVAKLMSLPVFNYQHGGEHYKDMVIEPAVFVAANNLDANQGNVIKYVTRHPFKNGEQDLDKAIHNIEMIKQTRY